MVGSITPMPLKQSKKATSIEHAGWLVLTGSDPVGIVPIPVTVKNRFFLIDNQTEQPLEIKYPEGGGKSVTVQPNTRRSVLADGANVEDAFTSFFNITQAELDAGIHPQDLSIEPYNVKRYGAVGDGVADDTSAIATAELAAFTANETLVFPPGIYLHIGARQYRCSISGYGATIKNTISIEQSHNTASAVIRFQGETSIVCAGITVDCNSLSTGFSAVSCTDVLFRDCVALNCLNACFNTYSSTRTIYERCRAVGVKYALLNLVAADGFYAGSCFNNVYINCHAENFERIGFVSDGDSAFKSFQPRYIACRAQNGNNCDRSPSEFNAGFWLENCHGGTIDHCEVLDMAGNAGQTSARVRGIVLLGGGDTDPSLFTLGNTTIGDVNGTLPVAVSVDGDDDTAKVVVHDCIIFNHNIGIAVTGGIDSFTATDVLFRNGAYTGVNSGGVVIDATNQINTISLSKLRESNATYTSNDAATINGFAFSGGGSRILRVSDCHGITMRTTSGLQAVHMTDCTINKRSNSSGIAVAIAEQIYASGCSFTYVSGNTLVLNGGSLTAEMRLSNCLFIGFAAFEISQARNTTIDNCMFKDTRVDWTVDIDVSLLKFTGCTWRNGSLECIRSNFNDPLSDTLIAQNCSFYSTAAVAVLEHNVSPAFVILQGCTYTTTALTDMTTTSAVDNVDNG